MPRVTASRVHYIDMGHRVANHEGKCASLHGHTYGFEFELEAVELDPVGRVVDFGVIKTTLCQWLEDNWDHKLLIWKEDEEFISELKCCPKGSILLNSIAFVPFNPTAENIAMAFTRLIAPNLLPPEVVLTGCKVWETRKCSARYEI